MRMEEIGIDPKTHVHDGRLTSLESRFLGILWNRSGRENKITADELAGRMYLLDTSGFEPADGAYADIAEGINPRAIALWQREVRYLQNHLLFEHRNAPVLSKAGPGGGYWMAENEAEATEFYATFRRRALTGMVKASRGKKGAMVDMMTQLSFEFGAISDASGMPAPARPEEQRPLPAFLADRLLERMLADPERFEGDLRRIGDKFGRVLFSTAQAARLKAMAAEIGELAARI